MDNEGLEEQNVPSAVVTCLHFGLLQEDVIVSIYELKNCFNVFEELLLRDSDYSVLFVS